MPFRAMLIPFGPPALMLAVLMASGSQGYAREIHVSPSGDDGNTGTRHSPVATPQRARDLARDMIRGGLDEPVDVVFSQGTYHLHDVLELRSEDSGTTEFPVTWRAMTGARVVLSGGLPVPRKWKRAGNGIWSVELGGHGPAGWNFRQLFVNGKRAIRARFPNASEANPFLYATGGDMDHVVIRPEQLKECWGSAKDAQLNMVPNWRFFNQWNSVTGVNVRTGRIDIADSERHGKIIAGNWFWIEGVREELDEPGEWFLDPERSVLFYLPETGVDPNTLDIVAPVIDRIVDVRGDVNAGTHVGHVRFEGLEFRHTAFTLGHIEARVHTDAAIYFENTHHCEVRNCQLENLGGYALWLHLDSRNNVFDRNTVRDAGAGGVLMTGARFSYMDDSKVFTPGEAAAKVFPILNSVTRNTVEHCGRIRYYGGGVHMDSRPYAMSMEPGNRIAHNHFNDLSRNGIFAFRNQGGNVVEFNHIHNAMQTTIDGGCIHFATMNRLTAPNFILNNWLHDSWGYERKPEGVPVRKLANGIFLDWDTSNTTVRNNWIYNTVGGAIKPIWENWNLAIEDNQTADERIVPPFANEIGPAGSASNRIEPAATRLTGGVIHHTDRRHVATTGAWQHRNATGMWGLFEFNFLTATAAVPSEAVYTLPIQEDGLYQVCLLYQPGRDRASNVPVAVRHADGTTQLAWDMRKGSKNGFAVEIGKFRFEKGKPAQIVLSSAGADGVVVADAVAYVLMKNGAPSEAGPHQSR